MINLLVIILGLLVGAVIWSQYVGGYMGKNDGRPEVVEGMLNTFTGRLAVDDMDRYDALFDNVFYYPNTDPFAKNMTTGWEQCVLENPTGHCVEYGPTGVAYAFAY